MLKFGSSGRRCSSVSFAKRSVHVGWSTSAKCQGFGVRGLVRIHFRGWHCHLRCRLVLHLSSAPLWLWNCRAAPAMWGCWGSAAVPVAPAGQHTFLLLPHRVRTWQVWQWGSMREGGNAIGHTKEKGRVWLSVSPHGAPVLPRGRCRKGLSLLRAGRCNSPPSSKGSVTLTKVNP